MNHDDDENPHCDCEDNVITIILRRLRWHLWAKWVWKREQREYLRRAEEAYQKAHAEETAWRQANPPETLLEKLIQVIDAHPGVRQIHLEKRTWGDVPLQARAVPMAGGAWSVPAKEIAGVQIFGNAMGLRYDSIMLAGNAARAVVGKGGVVLRTDHVDTFKIN